MKPAGPSQPLALAHEGLAWLEYLQDRWPQALRMFDKTRRDFEAIGNSSGAATDEMNVALLHAKLGHQGFRDAFPTSGRSESFVRLEMLLAEDRTAEVRIQAEAVLKSADAGDLESRRVAALALGLALARGGSGSHGLEDCRKAYDLSHKTGNPAAEAELCWPPAEAALAAADRTTATQDAGRAKRSLRVARKPESLWRACMLILRANPGDRTPLAAQAAAALAQLKPPGRPTIFAPI